MNSLREQLIDEAEAYQRDDMPLPLDLISSLMLQGIDHTQFSDHQTSSLDEETHNVD